ncbi:MAG: hypothetical protein HON04_12965 [Planctomicrobium sp.]|mgnify:CR=1 FL=1|nr:hypothetical protein [Planctomicrobium sp.]
MTEQGEFPPTIFVVHPKEKRSKCSVEPLRGTEGFSFWKFPKQGDEPISSYVRLGIGGPELTAADAKNGLLILDGTWRLAEKMEQDYQDLPIRSLSNWQTAYPRKSKLFEDPCEGLATVEALFAAYHQMGHNTDGLLDHYYWGDEFLKLNQSRIAELSTSPE